MISKELFCKTIADIQEQDRKISEFDHALGKICDSAVVFDADNLYLAALLCILKEELDDKADTIEWWGCMRMSANASGSTSKMVAGCATICRLPNPCTTILRCRLSSFLSR